MGSRGQPCHDLHALAFSATLRHVPGLTMGAYIATIGVATCAPPAGTVLGVGSWTAVSMLGSASTGIAISTLNGVAATNAALAWFGGGSLATGGAGMAGGGMMLGGIVIVPMVGISAWVTHSKASEIEQNAKTIEKVNKDNRSAIHLLQARIVEVKRVIPQFQENVKKLSGDIERIQKLLFPLGWLSRLWRRIRLYFIGYYYDGADMSAAEDLARSVDRFIRQFREHDKHRQQLLQ